MGYVGNRDIVCIGGSSVATPPLRAILGALRVDLPASVFIVVHIPARSLGILATMASAAGRLPVRQAADGMLIEPGHVYLAVPDHHLILARGRLRLGRGPRENMARPAIDPLFRSAAAVYGPRVIGVVLSGLPNDGATGLEAVKRCGGLVVVQDPVDAIADEMPRGAMHATTVDLLVPGTVVTFTDVTQVAQAQQLVRDSEARLRLVTDRIPQFVWTATGTGEWTGRGADLPPGAARACHERGEARRPVLAGRAAAGALGRGAGRGRGAAPARGVGGGRRGRAGVRRAQRLWRELIERALPYQLGAETRYALGPDGVRCTIVMPVPTEPGEKNVRQE